jgi:predicted esterase
MIQSDSIRVERSFRYAVREAGKKTETLVFLLHGYGQLAAYFIRKVEAILPENVTFVAPEGMHRFYLNGTSGRVGASWMTKEARELDIAENTEILDRLFEVLHNKYTPDKIMVIGFSQGGATAARWLASGKSGIDSFVSWASVFPPDVAIPENASVNNVAKRHFVLGFDDPFFDAQSTDAVLETYRNLGFEIIRFTGGHDLDAAIVQQLIQLL